MGSGKSQELFLPAQASCGKGAHCLEVMDPKPFGFSSTPLPTPHCAPSPGATPVRVSASPLWSHKPMLSQTSYRGP